jgi:hypothetical protein
VKKAAGIDLPVVDRRRKRIAFRLVGPVEQMWRDGRITDGQLAGFRKFERDMALTNPLKVLVSRVGSTPGDGDNEVEDVLSARAGAFKRLDDVKLWLLPHTRKALEAMVLNDVTLEKIGREVLMVRNKPQAITAAQSNIQQGTWILGVFYGCITVSDAASIRPG